jgi:hypothetical protein
MIGSLSLAGWSFIVAAAGFVVAALSYLANRNAIRREETDRRKANDDAWAREWAAQRPVIYPVLTGATSAPFLPLKNGGRGPALNVEGELEYRSNGKLEGTWRIIAGTIAAGDVEKGLISPQALAPPWHGVSGLIRYADLAGVRYRTRFEFSPGPHGVLELTVHEQEHQTPLDAAAEPPPP